MAKMPGTKKRPVMKSNRKRKPALAKSKAFIKAVTAVAQKVVHKDAENKEAYHSIDSVYFNSAVNSLSDVQRIVPNITLGTGDNNRVGSQVRAQRFNIKGHMILSTANNSIANTRIAVRMMVVCPKNLQGYSDVANNSSWYFSLLKKGGTAVAFTGLISDLYAPINSDLITTYYDKVTYITMPYLYTSTLGVPTSGYSAASVDYVNSTRFFNISLKVKNKSLKYDETYSSTQCTSYSPVLILGYTHLDGSSPDVTSTQVALSYVSTLQYEDL